MVQHNSDLVFRVGGAGVLSDCCSPARVHSACPRRFLKERKEITEKFAAEQDALLREAQEKHGRELRLLQERHQRHVLSLTAELEAARRTEQEELRASVEGEQRALAQAREAELQAGHAAALRALEARHSSHLDSLESRHRSEVQALREQHRRALEQLSAELEKQRQHKDASRPAAPPGERGQELPPADGVLTAQTDADPGAAGAALLYPEPPAAQQVRPGSGGSRPAAAMPGGFLAGGRVVGAQGHGGAGGAACQGRMCPCAHVPALAVHPGRWRVGVLAALPESSVGKCSCLPPVPAPGAEDACCRVSHTPGVSGTRSCPVLLRLQTCPCFCGAFYKGRISPFFLTMK